MGLRAFELMAAHTAADPAGFNPSLIVENSFLIFRNSQHSMRTFIKTFIALAEAHQIDKFVLGLPGSFDYVNSPIEVDGLRPGSHYLLSTSSGPQVIDAQFSDKVFADYRKTALLDFGVRPEQWQWLWASVPQNYISAMGMNALGLRWNTVGCF
jgi:hypothetical protein